MNFPKLKKLILIGAGLALLAGCSRTDDPETIPDGWVNLFNGVNFDGWVFDVKDGSPPDSIWSVRDGIVVVNGKDKSAGVLRTAQEYDNYELQLQWRWTGKPGNSGVLVHSSTPRFMNIWPKSLEVQLQHKNAGDLIVIGETIEVPPEQIAEYEEGSWKERLRHNLTDDSENDPGKWNRLRVISYNGSITVYVNDDLVNKGKNASVTSGAICLQAEGANIEFQSVRLKSL